MGALRKSNGDHKESNGNPMGIPWESNGNIMEIAWKSKREIRKSNGNPRGTIRISNGDHKQIPCVFVLGGGGVGGPARHAPLGMRC